MSYNYLDIDFKNKNCLWVDLTGKTVRLMNFYDGPEIVHPVMRVTDFFDLKDKSIDEGIFLKDVTRIASGNYSLYQSIFAFCCGNGIRCRGIDDSNVIEFNLEELDDN